MDKATNIVMNYTETEAKVSKIVQQIIECVGLHD